MRGSRGGGGAGDPGPPKSHTIIGVRNNSGPDPMKTHKRLPSQHSMFGHHQRYLSADCGGVWILSPLINVVKVGLNFLDPRMSALMCMLICI